MNEGVISDKGKIMYYFVKMLILLTHIYKFNQLLTADAKELQTSKMAARRFITTPEKLYSVSQQYTEHRWKPTMPSSLVVQF